MNDQAITIRLAHIEDAAEIANVHINSWQETYQGLLSEDYLSTLPLTFSKRMKMWKENIGLSKNGIEVWVVHTKEHGIVGFSSIENARDKQFEGMGELGSIYLLKHYHGQGIGAQLLSKTFKSLIKKGFTKAYCWVLDKNPTILFYKKSGAEITNIKKVDHIWNIQVSETACIWNNLH